MTGPYQPLRTLFADAGYAFVEPPIVYDAGVFVELLGESVNRPLADGVMDSIDRFRTLLARGLVGPP